MVKVGHSTGWTAGQVNAMEAVFSGKTSPYKSNIVAWPVVCAQADTYEFALPGDAGSVVLDADDPFTTGCWIGLLFAANVGFGIEYFTPIEMVLDDISAVTGCEVLEPFFHEK